MPVRLNGSTSGYTELSAPAVAGSNTLTLPTGNGSNGQFLQGNGSGALSWSGSLTLGTAQNSTSGTSIDFTSIPSWVTRITLIFNGVSTSGTAYVQTQLGTSSGFQTTSYSSGAALVAGSTATSTTGLLVTQSSGAADVRIGTQTIVKISGNTWIASASIGLTSGLAGAAGGSVTLSGTLDRVRITTSNGTDTFDAGSINILYEG